MKGGNIVPYIYSIITVITILTFNIGFSEYNISKKNPKSQIWLICTFD